MQQMKEENDGRALGWSRDLKSVQYKALLMMYIIDLLPWQDDDEGKTIDQIADDLAALGIRAKRYYLERAMRKLRRAGNIDWTGARPRRFRRFHPHRLSDCLSEKYALPLKAIPDMSSEIQFNSKPVDR